MTPDHSFLCFAESIDKISIAEFNVIESVKTRKKCNDRTN